MRILITGDSWSQGEWDGINVDYRVTHKGIEQYLLDDGYDVVNVGQGGFNNLQSLESIQGHEFNHLIFFWTDPLRQATLQEFTDNLPMSVISEHTDWMMRQLDQLVVGSQLPTVTLIGGCAKITYYKYRPDIRYVIPSISELLVPGFEDSPYMTSHEWENHWKNIRTPSEQFKREIVDITEKAGHKYDLWKEHPDLFWPDGLHANRRGTKIVYDHMRSLWNTD